jgi:HAD superfamily hydrolase (TIGR01490 family)
MITAIFDLDGTLYTGHILRGIEQHHRQHRVKRLPLYAYLLSHAALWPFWRLGLIPEATSRDLWSRHFGWTVRGWTTQEAAPAFQWVAEQYVLPRLRPDVLAHLREHQAAAHRVILVSGTLEPLLTVIGRGIDVQETVGTPLVVRHGRYTGAVQLPVCQGEGKVLRLEAYSQSTIAIPWEESYAYADSHTDLPLLERVGHPVAVYPDVPLAEEARQRGWEILGEVSPVESRRF